MIIKFSVNNEQRQHRHSSEIDLKGYHMTSQVIEDLERVLRFHELQYEDFKRQYLEKYGEEWFKRSYCQEE